MNTKAQKKSELYLLQAVEASSVVRCRKSYVIQTIGS
jgi:hypothetical protein